LGLDAIDVLFTDRVAHGPDLHSERLVNLPSIVTYWPHTDTPDVNYLPCLNAPPTFAAFHRPQKLNARVLQLWARVLEAIPGSRIIFKGLGYTPERQAWIREVLGTHAEFRPHSPQTEHLATYHECDLTLDTFPQNGCITTCDGLYMGVPPITLIGPRVVQRTSASILTNCYLTGFIAYSEDDYVALITEWVTDRRNELAEIRRRARQRLLMSPVCCGYVEAVESAYRELWREWCQR
jgi:predicted O-linked N-acetylglucosamine transferase (SPINDLY family)